MLEMHAGQPPLGRVRLPVEAAGLNHEAAFLGQIDDVAHPQQGVLQMGRDDREIVRVEGDKSEEIHGPINLLLSLCH
jgi:hypothetical protein